MRENVYRGPAWYCQAVVRDMLEETKEIEQHHLQRSFVPTATLPPDIFQKPIERLLFATRSLGDDDLCYYC